MAAAIRVSKRLLQEDGRRGAQEAFECEDPSLFFLLGAGLLDSNEFEAAASAFSHSLLGLGTGVAGEMSHLPTWLALGDALLFAGEAPRAVEAYEHARALGKGEGSAVSSLLRAKALIADWRDRRLLSGEFRERALSSTLALPPHVLDGSLATQAGINFRYLLPLLVRRQDAVELERSASMTAQEAQQVAVREEDAQTFTIGFITADLGVHPVAMLIRSALPELARADGARVLAFALQRETSWWRRSLEEELAKVGGGSKVVDASGRGPAAVGALVQTFGVDVLFDLGGNTLHGALQTGLFAARGEERIAPVVATWLGHTESTGSRGVLWFLGDATSTAPETALHFRESLALLGGPSLTFLPSDHLEAMGHVLWPPHLLPRSLPPPHSVDDAFAFACLSGIDKVDWWTFHHVWLRILQRVPGSVLWFLDHGRKRGRMEKRGMDDTRLYEEDVTTATALANLRRESEAAGELS